jgi:hypothetical protein
MTDRQVDAVLDAIRAEAGPTACAVCGRRGEVELTPDVHPAGWGDEPAARAYLCYEDLGPFLGTFTDPGISDWTVARLPADPRAEEAASRLRHPSNNGA